MAPIVRRLHESDQGTWIAYAQWPDRAHWEHVEETLGVDLVRAGSPSAFCWQESRSSFHSDSDRQFLQAS